MKIKNDVFESISDREDGVFIGTKEGNGKFPYNIRKIRVYMKKTGKALDEMTPREISDFAVARVQQA